MAEQSEAINVSNNPIMKQLVDEVFHSRQRKLLRDEETGAEVEVRPLGRKRSRIPRGKPTSAEDPMWRIIGMATGEGAADVAENHDKYLADAYADTHE